MEGPGYKVEILGHSASGVRGIDPDNPKLKMGELVSAPALERYCEREEAVGYLFNWLRGKREDPEIELALRRMGEILGRVVKKLLGWEYWRGVERIYIGGGLSEGRSGDILVNKASEFLAERDVGVNLQKIHYHPAVAGLVGVTYFLPLEMADLKNITVDLGGGILRTGIVDPPDEYERPKAIYSRLLRWQDLGMERETLADLIASEVVGCLKMSEKTETDISEYVGVALPAVLDKNGYVIGKDRNLPGDWTDPEFNLPDIINSKIEEETNFGDFRFVLKNDAVSQGLSEIPFAKYVGEWGILTVGTGLGNARFRNPTALE